MMMQGAPPGIKAFGPVWALLSSWSIPSLASGGGIAGKQNYTARLCVVLFLSGKIWRLDCSHLGLFCSHRSGSGDLSSLVSRAPSHQFQALLWKQVSSSSLGCSLTCGCWFLGTGIRTLDFSFGEVCGGFSVVMYFGVQQAAGLFGRPRIAAECMRVARQLGPMAF